MWISLSGVYYLYGKLCIFDNFVGAAIVPLEDFDIIALWEYGQGTNAKSIKILESAIARSCLSNEEFCNAIKEEYREQLTHINCTISGLTPEESIHSHSGDVKWWTLFYQDQNDSEVFEFTDSTIQENIKLSVLENRKKKALRKRAPKTVFSILHRFKKSA